MLNMENIRFGQSSLGTLSLFGVWLVAVGGCGNKTDPNACAPAQASAAPALSAAAKDQGTASVFIPDPIGASGDLTLAPSSAKLDSYRTSVTLSHLNGKGILQGKYVEVVNGLKCNQKFGAFDPKQQFEYLHSDWRFQEAMAYHFGDTYQTQLDQTGYLRSAFPVRVVAHCELADNAYFTRTSDSKGNPLGLVCLGDSVATPGAFYSDDAVVTVHELQHAATADNYSLTQELNQLWYDEAGSLNEAISDFMGLLFTDPLIPSQFQLDPRTFSRWALGTFFASSNRVRGAHLCPQYDSGFPNCNRFPSFTAPTTGSPNLSSISYVYPDGMGWPYPKNTSGSLPISQVFKKYLGQEEIHNAGVLMEGALWDVFQAIKASHVSDGLNVSRVMSQLILESLRHLPQANRSTNHSPVNYRGFSSNLVTYSAQVPGLTTVDQTRVAAALKNRGLHDSDEITDDAWLQVGTGTNWVIPSTVTPGVFVQDDPHVIISWLNQMGADSSMVKQGPATGLNSRLDPGEVAALWFDLQNQGDLTAGGVLLTVTSSDSDLEILGSSVNIGYLNHSGLNQTQITYQKVNGNAIVSALNPGGAIDSIPIGNSYFKTNPFFNQNWRTAVWVRVKPDAAHDKDVGLVVSAAPTNGITSSQNFSVRIH